MDKDTWNHNTGCWTSRLAANATRRYLIAFGIPERGVELEKSGTEYRLYFPLLAEYWWPWTSWEEEANRVKAEFTGMFTSANRPIAGSAA